jgi:hypothetical protein
MFDEPQYAAEMIVDLIPPYAVALESPIVVETNGIGGDELVSACWEARRQEPDYSAEQLRLFS